jgi:hypothetical protein
LLVLPFSAFLTAFGHIASGFGFTAGLQPWQQNRAIMKAELQRPADRRNKHPEAEQEQSGNQTVHAATFPRREVRSKLFLASGFALPSLAPSSMPTKSRHHGNDFGILVSHLKRRKCRTRESSYTEIIYPALGFGPKASNLFSHHRDGLPLTEELGDGPQLPAWELAEFHQIFS